MTENSEAVEVQSVFIAAGCNRIVNNVSWGACGLVSFGSQNAVAIFCPKTARILTTVPGHKASVNCTQWIPSTKFAFRAQRLERHYLLSGDSEGVIILWEFSLIDTQWRQVMKLPQLHKKGVTCIAGIMVSQTDSIFASSSSDGVVNIWDLVLPFTPGGECKLSCFESLSVGSKPMVALSLAELPGSSEHIVLAMGGLDNKIHVYCGQKAGKFIRACELKAHTDWIRSLDFSLPICKEGEANCIMLVSSSQDKGIRIWKMSLLGLSDEQGQGTFKKEITLASYIEGPIIVAGLSSYQISLESLLIGHEDWVYSVEWQPPSTVDEGITFCQPQSILSASMDKTMMIWQPEKRTGIWMNVVTVGELSHSALGFYGGHWSADGQSILAHGYGGAFHMWRNVGIDTDNWMPQKVPSGHFAPVSDISWARNGQYILTVSHDQTTRIFSPWKTEASSLDGLSWHEIARPQVHGHDINCVAFIEGKRNQRFICGADEKVARVFEAPLSFLKTLSHASQQSALTEDLQTEVQILGANMSALGLSQKPIYQNAAVHETPRANGNDGLDTLESVPDAIPVIFTEPPIEDQLAYHTLWPESHKLYGHGNELFSLCCDHEGGLVASSCKAQSQSVAEIWLWQVGSWKSVGRLQSHTLTVTQMEFSHDDSMLLAVSRDRQFSVFSIKRTGDEISYQLLAKQEAHKRIIWSCSWNPFGHEFATGSRDKTVKIWTVDGTKSSPVRLMATLPPFSSSVTAVAWLGIDRHRSHGLLAVGMENGLIELWHITVKRDVDNGTSASGVDAALAIRFDPAVCHVSQVNRLSWRSSMKSEDSTTVQLASCGADHCVRLFEVRV
ncbi:Elongator complex protein 2 [Linum perenne]